MERPKLTHDFDFHVPNARITPSLSWRNQRNLRCIRIGQSTSWTELVVIARRGLLGSRATKRLLLGRSARLCCTQARTTTALRADCR